MVGNVPTVVLMVPFPATFTHVPAKDVSKLSNTSTHCSELAEPTFVPVAVVF